MPSGPFRHRQLPSTAQLRVATPREAAKAAERHRKNELLFLNPPMPLYGLPPVWEGKRSIGGTGGGRHLRPFGPFGWFHRLGPLEAHRMSLHHVDPDGAELRVASHRDRHGRPLRERLESHLYRNLGFDERVGQDPSIKDLDAAADAWAERLARDEVTWRPTRIPVDGVPTEFSALGAASRWVATAHLGEIDLVLEAHRFPLDSVTLARLTDLSAYGVGASC